MIFVTMFMMLQDSFVKNAISAIDRKLPLINIDDYLFIHDSGAHGYSMGYIYNGRLRSAEILLKENGHFIKIRRAETQMNYFITFDEFPIFNKLKE